jgi:drug/metabolite transporter (DMT)-like permease
VGLAAVSAVSFGLSGPFAKALIDAGWSSNGALLVRLGGAAVVLAVVLAATRPGVLAALRRDGAVLVLYGTFAMAGVQGCFFNAVRYLPVPIALLLEYTSPILVIIWVWLVRHRRPSRLTVLGGAIALAGLSLVVRVWSGFGLDWRGLAWGLGAAVCAAAYFLLADRADSSTSPLVLAGVGMAVGTAVSLLAAMTGLLPVVLTNPHPVTLGGADVGWPLAAAFLVLVPTVLAYLVGIAAVRRIGASRASLVGLLEVVSAGVGSWLLLGEVPTAVQCAGGALLLAGVALTQCRPDPVASAASPAGGQVTITRGAGPVARPVPVPRHGPRALGRDRGLFRVPEAFDAPLGEGVPRTFEQ